MTIYMSELLCVTNRLLCREEFLTRIERIARARPKGIILREKNLPQEAYRALAQAVLAICGENHVPCILHNFAAVAKELGATAIHLPLPALKSLSDGDKACFSVLGASCHSVEDAVQAQRLGCTYITAGHVFATDCKKGLPGRGLEFLRAVCQSVQIPVYAIGGIQPGNFAWVLQTGAKGACVMSGAMVCENPEEYFASFKAAN